ncbi:MAG: PIN domain-containing protein [Rugosibacter sp.]
MKHPPDTRERLAQHAAGQLAMSVITLGELRHGAKKSQSPKKAFTATFAAAFAAIEQLTNTIQIAVLDDHAGQHWHGKIRSKLEQSGQTIGNNDLWIAAHAKAAGWILVTHNEDELTNMNSSRWPG